MRQSRRKRGAYRRLASVSATNPRPRWAEKMKKTLATLSFVLICTPVYALEFDPFKGPKPIVVLIQTDPWLLVIGSDTPMVTIYDDGQVVYLKREKDKMSVLHHKQLSPDAFAEIKKKLSSFGNYSKLKSYYKLVRWTDQPKTEIYLSLDGSEFVTSVYGLRVSDTKIPEDSVLERLPIVIKDLHAYLTSLDFADAKPWEPPYVEVMIWGASADASDELIHWPKDWPGLSSPSTLKRGDSYSIFLPGKELLKLRKFLKTGKKRGAVEIDGENWSVSVRYTFPSEPVWLKAFRGVQSE